eukprot:TRINITY_DN2085_c0_g2_i1.p1 TRINITY_DN2085_c0_g2~~TRINITY_DN2085_c0_g2_i1.p1  ORF type:complete len:493 (-),score=90.88 TRINITY_DN2085_c0_g2_i1:95-1477(-)
MATDESAVIELSSDLFDIFITEHKYVLVEFYTPWCGHCKKLAPEYERAATRLQKYDVILSKVDATVEKALAQRYNIKGYPSLVWLEDNETIDFDAEKTADGIVEFAQSMIAPPVTEVPFAPEPGDKPRVVLHGQSLLPSYEEVAKAYRRKAKCFYTPSTAGAKVVLTHRGEDSLTLADGADDKDKVLGFVSDNLFPLIGKLDADSYDHYMDGGKGIVWSLFPVKGSDFERVEEQYRPMMTEVATAVRDNFFVTMTDTVKFAEALKNMLSVSEFPAIVVHKQAGDKRRYVYNGEMNAQNIIRFIKDVETSIVQPTLKSEPVPASNGAAIRVVVGSTLQEELFDAEKDVLMMVYAPWCGHCKKLEPEYQRLGNKLMKEGMNDLLTIAKLDGTANDSPIDSVDWTGFPTLFFSKAGNSTPMIFNGEKTAKGIWKYIRKHATQAQEIRERISKRRDSVKGGDEL